MSEVIITVVIVCKNALSALRETIYGLERLQDSRIRIIVIDGASNDGTPEWLLEYETTFDRWISEPDSGIYQAMNKGWNLAVDNSYILFLGAGDQLLSLPTSEEFYDAPSDSLHPIVMGDCDTSAKTYKSAWDEQLRHYNTAHHQALAIRKNLAPISPFDETREVYADWEFNIVLFKRGVKAVYRESLKSSAATGGASSLPNIGEAFAISKKHFGVSTALIASLRSIAHSLMIRLMP